MAILTKGKGGALKASEVSNAPAGNIAATDVQAALNELDTEKITNATHTGEVTGSQALTITSKAVTYAKIQDVSATDKLLGRGSAGAGGIEEITLTAAGRALLDDLTAAAQRGTMSAAQSGVNEDITSIIQAVGAALYLIGNVKLDSTTASTKGVILKDATPFIHDFHHPTGDTAVPVGSNIFVGLLAGNFTTGGTATGTYHGSYNTGLGVSTLSRLTSGYSNLAMGQNALFNTTTGFFNTAIGSGALVNITTGTYNIGIGASALRQIIASSLNVGVGVNAGYHISGGGNNTASYGSVFVGYDTRALADSQTNQVVIGHAAIGKGSNTVTIGNDSITDTYLKGSINMGQGGQTVKRTTVSAATYSTLVTDYILHVTYTATGACTITIPTAQITDGRIFKFKDAGGNAGTNNITIATQGTETIDGAATQTISANYGKLTLYSDGSNLFII